MSGNDGWLRVAVVPSSRRVAPRGDLRVRQRRSIADGRASGVADAFRIEIGNPSHARVYDNAWGAPQEGTPSTAIDVGHVSIHQHWRRADR